MRWLPVLVAVALAVGTVLGATVPAVLSPALAALVCGWAAALWAWRESAPRALAASVLATLVALGALSGAAAMRRAVDPPLFAALRDAGLLGEDGASPPVRLEGRLTADAWPAGPVTLLRVRLRRVWLGPCGCPSVLDDEVQLSVAGTLAAGQRDAWRAGRSVSTEAALREPVGFRNLGAPDERLQRARRRLAAIGHVKSALQVEVRRGGPLSEALAAIRFRARAAIAAASGGDATAAAIATAVLLGDRSGLEPELEARLQRAGTFHVVAISGGNIALWAAGTIWLSTRITRHRGAALLGAAVVLILYAALVGGGASVQRATGMALVGLAARGLDQRGAGLNVLAVTASVLLAADPLLVYDVAFLLTCGATLGLVVGMPDAPTASRIGRLLRALFLTSVAAEAALLPIVAAVFQQVTLAGLLLSAVAVPAMAVVQVTALSIAVADPVASWAVWPAGLVMRAATGAVVQSAPLVDWLPWLAWRVPPPAPAAIAVYYGALAGWLWTRTVGGTGRARLRRACAVVAAASATWIATSPATLLPGRPGDLRLVTFDVGQGAAALVHFPRGHRLLVDAGGVTGRGRDLGEMVVGPALRSRGVRRLDTLVVTHADRDHAGGAATVIRQFRPAAVWVGIPVAGDATLQAMLDAAREVGAQWRWARRGERVDIDGVRVAVVHPPPPGWERQRVRNDDSVVLTIDHADIRVVLPGDVGADVEPEIAQAIDGLEGPSPGLLVLAAGHHGSAGSSSTAWLAALRPAAAVVSAGRANPFGHPAAATLARLRASGTDVWRTDRDGEITVTSDGRRLVLSSFTGRRRTLAAPPDQPR